ncbi:MAG: DUF1559 domain-containing protein, partial [Actinomycetota bacterium]
EAARATQCKSNLKQITTGILMYSQDYDELLPFGGHGGAAPNRWHTIIEPYTKSAAINRCPSYNVGTNRGYGTNVNLMEWGVARSLPEIQKPAEAVIVADTAQCNATVATDHNPLNWVNYQTGQSDWQFTPPRDRNGGATGRYTATGGNETRRPIARHSEMLNVGYMDGHVKAEKPQSLLGPLPAGGAGAADFFDVY